MEKPSLEPPILFISDAHLGGFSEQENARIESELIQLLNFCQRNNIHLAVLGDLFDYWMEYPNTVPKLGQQLLGRFEEFNNQLGPTLYITGNHDNWTGGHLQNRGFVIEHEFKTFSIDDKLFMVLHGDGLSDNKFNLPRPKLHRFIRSDSFIRIFQRVLPPRMGLTIMKYFSRLTRFLDQNQDEETLLQWAKYQLKHQKVSTIICGHNHVPRQKQFPFGTYINLGTFYKHRTMAYYNKGEISLVHWELQTQSLQNYESNYTE